MRSVTSFRASDLPPEQLNDILCDFLAAERARVHRKLFVVRFGALALVVAAVGMLWLSARAFAASVGMCLVPPAWAWVLEIRQERRLARRIAAIPAAVRSEQISDNGSVA